MITIASAVGKTILAILFRILGLRCDEDASCLYLLSGCFITRSTSRGQALAMLDCRFHRRARACPSPCTGLSSNHPGSLSCGRFSPRSVDRGGQAPALRWRKASLHRRARACPSPCTGLSSNHPGSLGCGHFPQRLRDRGGQAPALRYPKRPLSS